MCIRDRDTVYVDKTDKVPVKEREDILEAVRNLGKKLNEESR